MENEYMKRGFLLPEGCKDLVDKLQFKAQPQLRSLPTMLPSLPPPAQFVPFSLIKGELVVAEPMTVRELAVLLKQKPFEIIGGLMQLGVFATVNHVIGFAAITKLARLYGFSVRKAS